MNPSPSKLDLVLLWHMHQPDYRDRATGDFALPWVYLHAIKDYTDMADHLERHPGVKAVVNFVPVLLDQLEAYAEQFQLGVVRDPLLKLLTSSNLDHVTPEQRRFVIDACFRSNHTRMVDPFAPYKRLREIYQQVTNHGDLSLDYLSGQYLADLLTWYHLAWTGESVRRKSELVTRLMAKGEHFSHGDRYALYQLIGELVAGVIPRYRRLAERGQVELSTTPHNHPLAPLLIDFKVARDAMPEAPLPRAAGYAGGRSRVERHLRSAQASHAARFGAAASGVWPAEGALSDAVLEIFAREGVGWAASGQQVLANTITRAQGGPPGNSPWCFQPYRYQGTAGTVACFFRNDQLSDLIGFEYQSWFGRDAATDFLSRLHGIARGAPGAVVSVILDGENAWEYYPYNGYYFLDDLYAALESDHVVRTTTYRDYLARKPRLEPLPPLVAGSWVYGTLSTWIGEPAKNAAWDLIAEAKRNYDLVIESGRLKPEEAAAAEQQLMDCESSDWFWWLGDYNPAHAVASFERRFRAKLSHLYRLLKLPPPEVLRVPLSTGGGHPEVGGAMRRAS
ncbi:MAG TPA: glycoside hydrolase family 57 protein [Pelomicrobium sp.]|nr:glycoside hydrolase family 57 protein [Pelomicrobium sp.]